MRDRDLGERSVHHARGLTGPIVGISTYLYANATGVILASENVASITDLGAGELSITFDRDYANANYAVMATADSLASIVRDVSVNANVAKLTGLLTLQCTNITNAKADPIRWNVFVVGTLA